MAEIIDPPVLRTDWPRSLGRRRPGPRRSLAVDLIITGDADFLTLGSYAGIPIVDTAEAITRIGGQTG